MHDKSETIRTYDIKGSLNNRNVLKEKRINFDDEDKLRSFTLKDKDFKVL